MAKSKTRQFYCYKFSSSRLKKDKYEIETNFNQAKRSGEIIAIADNQILRTIRDIKGIVYNKEIVEQLYKERDFYKKQPSSKENIRLLKEAQHKINHILFYPQYVTVTIDSFIHYDHIAKYGFKVNGMLYRRLSCSAGQARNSIVLMCSEDIIEDVKKVLNNNRDVSVPIAPSKLNAYFGLYSSATQIVTEPRFCVVPDFNNEIKFDVNFVTETSKDMEDIVEDRTIVQEITRTDGMGLISPEMAQVWAKDLNLDYVPSQFVVRQSFLKGLVTVFDFKLFCEEKNNSNYLINTIYKDESGEPIKADLRNCDLIISESQFKLWNAYPNQDFYIESYRSNNIKWGVSQYSPEFPEDTLFLNYQFIQSLNLNEEDIKSLCEDFKDWIEGVSIDNVYYTLLFLVGQTITEKRLAEYLKSWEMDWIRSLILDHDLINDKYIREKINHYIQGAIKRAYLGGIPVEGNFQYLITDPYAYMEYVCGKKVRGLLGKDEHYSHYWNEKGVKQADGMRAPLTHFSEHTLLNLQKNEETEKWYKWCKTGIIINWFGYEVCKFAGADFDGDILATTSNKIMIKGIFLEEKPVVYSPPKPEKIANPCESELVRFDKFGMGSIIGQITNKGASAYALLPNLKEKYGENSEEYKITLSRLKQVCKAQSQQIDKTKIGKEVKGIPKCWYEKDFYTTEKSSQKTNNINNHILLNKRPYFFKYLYDDSKKEYNIYFNSQDYRSKKMFRKNLKTLLEEDVNGLTEEEKEFIKEFYHFSPLIISSSPMNLLCGYIENINKSINKRIRNPEIEVDYSIFKKKDVEYTEEQKEKLIKTIKDFNRWYSTCLSVSPSINLKYWILRENLFGVENNTDVITNILVDYCYKDGKGNKDLVWSLFGREVFNNILANSEKEVFFPFPDEKGELKYLNKRFSVKRVGGENQC